MTLDLSAVLSTATTVARDAGKILMSHFERPLTITTKSSPYDVVTQADAEAEAFILKTVAQLYPDHHLIAEESGESGGTGAYNWVIDPLDGTVNFAHSLPVFSVSIALTDAEMTPLVGVVYNPVADELFSAVKGGGAFLNDQPIRVSDTRTVGEALLASGFPYDKSTDPDNNLMQWGKFLIQARGLRRLGSAALDLCYVAAGRFDGYWEAKLKLWDFMAGLLIVQESGGTVTDYRGGVGLPMIRGARLVASNGHLHQQMIDILDW
ncbi:MAG: inositol monophosphatase [Anaerolineae bacterium]|nr:inositol monophosphatase [Anaerolineae bacterium]